jgi:predicted amidohydrolase
VPPFRPATRFELVAAINEAETLWDLCCALLGYWRSTAPVDSPWHHMTGPSYLAWSDTMYETRRHFAGPRASDDIDGEDREFLFARTGRGLSADAVHAAAWGLSTAVSHTFAPAWRDALGGRRHTLAHGELYPVADAPWSQLGVELTPRPGLLSTPDVGELPTIRVHDASDFDVTVDFTLARTLEAVVSGLDRVVAVHPNERLDEIALPVVDRQIFPVAPANPEQQRSVLLDLVARALETRATVTVLPELSVTADDVEALHGLVVEHEQPHLLVAGSYHATIGGEHENVAVGLVSGHDVRIEHRKTTPFTDELRQAPPEKEGIRRRERLHVVVHQADRFRVSLVICKELLDRRLPAALDRMGANLLLVPAFSAKTTPFADAVAGRVSGAQALTVVVNGPLRGAGGEPVAPAVVVGQPVAGRSVVPVDVPGPAPVVTVVELPA